jgi:hypothetical protein
MSAQDDYKKMRTKERQRAAKELEGNVLLNYILETIEQKAINRAVMADYNDHETRTNACFMARAARTFRNDLQGILAETATKGDEE